jgi:hypothetical protein
MSSIVVVRPAALQAAANDVIRVVNCRNCYSRIINEVLPLEKSAIREVVLVVDDATVEVVHLDS